MTKKGLRQRICDTLSRELEALSEAARATYEGATDAESKSENKYDTRALEASYLAGAQARRAAEVRETMARYQTLTMRVFADDAPIALTALVLLDCDGTENWYFLGPCGGGIKVEHEGREVVVITPSAPLGKSLLGREIGDVVTVGGRSGSREYEVLEVL